MGSGLARAGAGVRELKRLPKTSQTSKIRESEDESGSEGSN